MIVVDVNLLIYAVFTGFAQHAAARAWWESCLNDESQIGLADVTVFGFLRLSTNPRMIDKPLSVGEALGYVSQWLDRAQVRRLLPGLRYLDIAFDLVRNAGTAGNLTTDAQLAALAIEHQAELHSNDTDFGRFAGLRWVNPLATSG